MEQLQAFLLEIWHNKQCSKENSLVEQNLLLKNIQYQKVT